MSHRYLRIIYSKLNSSFQCLLLLMPFSPKNYSSICVPNLSEWFQYQPFIQTRKPASSLSHTPRPPHPTEYQDQSTPAPSLYASLHSHSHTMFQPPLHLPTITLMPCNVSITVIFLKHNLFNVSPSQAPKEKRKLSIPPVPAHHPDFTNNQYNLCHHLGEIIWPFVPCF